jgi:hypothetical protein
VTHPASADALIDEDDFDRNERLPYWAELWPSAISLARYLHERDLAGARAIELGCGVGLPTIAALTRGAQVLYERPNAVALADLVPKLLALEGEAILADPRRDDAPAFLRMMEEEGFGIHTQDTTVNHDGREVRVLLHRLQRR